MLTFFPVKCWLCTCGSAKIIVSVDIVVVLFGHFLINSLNLFSCRLSLSFVQSFILSFQPCSLTKLLKKWWRHLKSDVTISMDQATCIITNLDQYQQVWGKLLFLRRLCTHQNSSVWCRNFLGLFYFMDWPLFGVSFTWTNLLELEMSKIFTGRNVCDFLTNQRNINRLRNICHREESYILMIC